MAKIQDNANKTKPRTSCFLGCFGFAGKVSEKKLLPEMVRSSCRKKARWFSWSRFRIKQPAIKTVPVDTAAVSEKLNRSKEIHPLKSDKKVCSKRHVPATRVNLSKSPATVSDQILRVETQKTRRENIVQDIIPEVRKNLDHLDSTKEDTCRKGLSSSRTRLARRNGATAGQPNSPEKKSELGETTAVLFQSISFPSRKQQQLAANAGGSSHVSKDQSRQGSNAFAGKFDPVVGVSIIMVTLIIMLLCGKLCAIVCTSAWFYFIRNFRKSVEINVVKKNELNSGNSDLNTEEYKKKVVLEGFLERNHRNIAGVL